MSDIAELVRRVRKKAGERYPVYIYDETFLGELADALEAQAEDLAGYKANELQLERWVEERDKRIAELENALRNIDPASRPPRNS